MFIIESLAFVMDIGTESEIDKFKFWPSSLHLLVMQISLGKA